MKRLSYSHVLLLAMVILAMWVSSASAQQAAPTRILIHMKTSLALDDAQICAVPNVAWAAVKAGHKVTILVDASAVTSVTKGFGWFRKLVGSDSTALDRAGLPERERQSLSEQMGVPLEQIPHNYGEYFDFLKKMGVEIYGNRTMMLLYKIDLVRVTSAVMPVPLERMIQLFVAADRVIVY
jgi:predicted peroxiredoxin